MEESPYISWFILSRLHFELVAIFNKLLHWIINQLADNLKCKSSADIDKVQFADLDNIADLLRVFYSNSIDE